MPNEPTTRTAVVVGATGIIGRAIAAKLALELTESSHVLMLTKCVITVRIKCHGSRPRLNF